MSNQKPVNGKEINVTHLLDGRHFGGAEQMVLRLIDESLRQGIKSSAICLSRGRLATFLEKSGLPFHVIPSQNRLDLTLVSSISRVMESSRNNLVQAHTSRTHLLSRIIGSKTRIPNITTIHSPIALDDNCGLRRHPVRAWIERMGRRWTQHIVCVSGEESERIKREENVRSELISWIPNGVKPPTNETIAHKRAGLNRWLEQNGYPTDTFMVGMIAQLRPRKGPEVLIEAFSRYRESGHSGVLLLIGDSEFAGTRFLEKLQDIAGKSCFSNDIHFMGFLDNPWSIASGLDICVLPSRFGEGLPLVLIEAMSYRIPLAVSDIAGNREIVSHARNGWIHPPGDAHRLAEQLHEASTNRSRLAEYGISGQKYFHENFTLDKICSRYIQLYHRLLG